MRVVLAPDSFKGSLSATAVCAAMKTGVLRAVPDAEVLSVPMADGGEGTLDCVGAATGGQEISLDVTDPLGRPVTARYLLAADATSAVVELASASGLTLIDPTDLAPLRADTHGTGQLIADAIRRGARSVLVCVGGSASTDGGTGLLRALGALFLDASGAELPPGGGALADLERVDFTHVLPEVHATRFHIACDVTNPLVGARGAAAVFGPQKGAGPDEIALLDRGLARLADVFAGAFGTPVHHLPGAGAAGGTCGGMLAALDATAEPGCELVARSVGLADALTGADLVLTGEGRLDRQSADGKVVSHVARLAAEQDIPVVALAGQTVAPLDDLYALGLTAGLSIADGPRTLDAMTTSAAELLAHAAEQTLRLRLG
ncbi:glycerate kinase [Streptomyces sp. NBC_01498]|uniref:glycerate kinase n=1 Tax=Streptomyces sp. NBC_01498 TaxID=2975870 RepID=UPI002E7B3429|nr:glycerate kinase [Streptomyces sp. NBC_01498]WTL28422.1 glycerate kinase [Streptomyces sp. NBC_01498]